jgi:hypothetical protein
MIDCRILAVPLLLLALPATATAQQGGENKAIEDAFRCSIDISGPADQFDCGFDKLNNEYVFVGTISAVRSAPKDEKLVDITADEVFYGEPGSFITALTSQGSCMEHLVVGEQWLFYLRKIDGEIILDYNMQQSAPVKEVSQELLERLRRLKYQPDEGILRGFVVHKTFAPANSKEDTDTETETNEVSDAQITAVRKSDQAIFHTVSGKDGSFEFRSLPVGDYEVEVGSIGSFHPSGMYAEIGGGDCRGLIFENSPRKELSRATIAGHVRWPSDKPAAKATVMIIDADNSGFNSIETDAGGGFSFTEQRPGKYVVGARLPGASTLKTWSCGGSCASELPEELYFYGNSTERRGAQVITLGVDEERDDIEITIPERSPAP